jgi:hypothetical protein
MATSEANDPLVQEASWGLSQIHLDRIEGSLQQARLRLVDEREHYLNQLDPLKVHLGLAPHAPIVPDKRILAGFRDTFEEIDRWCADPKREMTELPRIVGSLPALDDIVIDGHSAKAVYEVVERGSSHAVQREEEILSAGVKVALANHHRGDQNKARLELRVRRALRRLLRIRVAYMVEKRRFVLVTRRRDQAQERLLAPPRLATPRKGESQEYEGAKLIAELLESQGQMVENQNRLVSLWAEYQALRLALFRDLGTLPCDDWESFHDMLTARRGDGPS